MNGNDGDFEDRFGLVGETLAGRFQVERQVAEGGFGVVYRARQVALDRAVALKILKVPPHLSDGERAVFQRTFADEARTVARLEHPAIVGVHDFGSTDVGGRVLHWMALEWLEGETLEAFLEARRGEPMDRASALALMRPVLRAIGHAHRQRVAHRDLKPGNILLVSSHGGVEPKVLDFGIAKLMAGDAPAGPAATTAIPAFSPDYVAPEQLARRRTGPFTDVHALALILTEMLTGQPPYASAPTDPLGEVMHARRPTPATRGIDVGPWEPVLARAMALVPSERYPDADSFARALDGNVVVPAPRRPTSLRRPLVLGPAVLLLVAGLVLGGARLIRPRWGRAPAPRLLASVGFRDTAARRDSAWIGTAIEELLADELVAGGEVRRVPAETAARVRRDLQIADGATLAPPIAARVRDLLQADYLVGGTYRDDGGEGPLELELHVQDGRSAAILASERLTGRAADLASMTAAMAERVRRGLGLSPRQGGTGTRALPTDPAATRAYADGLGKLRRLEAQEAVALLEHAVRLDVGFAMGHAALAEAWRLLGRPAEEVREARAAWQRSAGLAPGERLAVETSYRIASKDWPRAIDAARAAYRLAPGSLDHGLRLAETQVLASAGRDALETLAALRRELPAAARDPRVGVLEAQAAEVLGDHRRSRAAADQAVQAARRLDARELLAVALMARSFAGTALGERRGAATDAADAYAMFREAGNPFGLARALVEQGLVAWDRGELLAARAAFEQAVDGFHRIGEGDQILRAYNGLAAVLSELGDRREAMRLYRLMLPLDERAGNRAALAATHINLGQQLRFAHQLAEAELEIQRGLTLAREIDKKNLEASGFESLGVVYLDQGDLVRAADTEGQGLAIATRIGAVSTIAQTRGLRAQALALLGQLAVAEKELRAAISSLEELGERTLAGNMEMHLAAVLLDLGRRDEAEATARRAVWNHGSAGVATGETGAALARILLALHRLPEARAAADGAAKQGGDLRVQIALAEVETAERNARAAIARLRGPVLDPAVPVPQRLDAAIVLGRAELAAGRRQAGQARLRAAGDEARRRGYALLARRAAVR